MNKWNMIIDVAECTNCNLCTLAAMDEYVGNDFPGYSAPMPKHGHKWIDILQKERGQLPMIDIAYVPTMCNHCDNAPCVAKSGGAIRKRDDGIVLIDPVKAKGRKDLVEACPYGHIWWNEELALPQAWTFDAHLIDQGWKQTRGQQSCPTGAMRAVCVADDEMAKLAGEQGLEVIKPELGTRPRVYYKNLWRYAKCFIAGSVSAKAKGVIDCVEGATVRLLKDGAVVAQTKTDNYGDFKFDRLDENSRRIRRGNILRPDKEDGYRAARRQRQSRRHQVINLPDPSTALVFPQLGALYQTFAPAAEALLRAVVGLALVPHGLRMTFGFFGNTGQPLRNIGMLADYLDRQGYRPGKVWAAAISADAARRRAAACARPVHAPRGRADRALPAGFEYRALARRQIFLEPARARIHADVDDRGALFSGARRRRLFARPARHRLGILTLKRITRPAANLRPSAQWARVGDARARHCLLTKVNETTASVLLLNRLYSKRKADRH